MNNMNVFQFSQKELYKKKCWINSENLQKLSIFCSFRETFCRYLFVKKEQLDLFLPKEPAKFEVSSISATLVRCSPLSLLGADLIIAKEEVSWGFLSAGWDLICLHLSSRLLSINCKCVNLSIVAIFDWFTSKNKEIDSLIMHFRIKNSD